jgi:hypothetical protein
MMSGWDEPTSAMGSLPTALQNATDAQGALAILVGVLQPLVPSLWRASIRRLLHIDEQLEVIAVWSAVETQLRLGARMSFEASSLPEIIRTGGPVRSTESAGSRLIDELLVAEGISSWVSIPLKRGDRIFALLSLSSFAEHAFDGFEIATLERIGLALADRLFEDLENRLHP